MPAHIFKFVSRAQQLQLRGQRNYSRWMLKAKGHVDHDGPEASQWRDEGLLEQKADAEWAKRHGPVEGGAWVARFLHSPEAPTPKRRRVAQRR